MAPKSAVAATNGALSAVMLRQFLQCCFDGALWFGIFGLGGAIGSG
jgi:hypothetical protein